MINQSVILSLFFLFFKMTVILLISQLYPYLFFIRYLTQLIHTYTWVTSLWRRVTRRLFHVMDCLRDVFFHSLKFQLKPNKTSIHVAFIWYVLPCGLKIRTLWVYERRRMVTTRSDLPDLLPTLETGKQEKIRKSPGKLLKLYILTRISRVLI